MSLLTSLKKTSFGVMAVFKDGTTLMLKSSSDEFASNKDTANAHDLTDTYLVYGETGSGLPSVATSAKYKKVRFKTARKPSDQYSIEVDANNNGGYLPLPCYVHGYGFIEPYDAVTNTGMAVSTLPTDVITDLTVWFGANGPNSSAAATWASFVASGAKWRVRKVPIK